MTINKIILLLFFIFLTVSQGKSQIIFSETFESGVLPAGWSNIFESGAINWTYATGGNTGHPATSHGGTKNALFFWSSYSGQTTKLVTSVQDLSAVNFPVLKFWHTQDAWAADQDILRIYYKTTVGGTWNLLETYTSEIVNWTQETIALPNKSATYYIAFEARTGWGYGVCIDDVNIEQTPTVPKTLSSLIINQATTDYLLNGSDNNPILRIDIDVAGNSGSLPLNSLEVNALNSNNNFINTNGVKIFATSSVEFSPVNQIGTAQSLSSEKAVFSSLNYDLPAGLSYLWISYDITPGALPDMVFDAFIDVNKIDIDGFTYPATQQSPSGNRILMGTVFQDDFETDKGWILTGEFERGLPQGLGGSYQNSDPSNAYSGTNVLGTDISGLGIFPGDYEPSLSNMVYSATSTVINCKYYTATKLRFYRWLNIENFDRAYIDISNDSGITWNQLWASTLSMNENSWSFQEIDIAAYADKKQGIKIRFSLGTTDGTNNCSGWNIDDVILTGDFFNPEVSVSSIILPANGCSHTTADSVKIMVKNSGGLPTNDTMRVCYSFNGGTTVIYDTIFNSIPLGDSLVFTFMQTADLSSPATYNFFAATLVTGDKNTDNDTLYKSITASPQFTIPYFTDFESGQNGWFTGGINSSWQFGTPSSLVINHAASGINAWKTGINNNYNSDEISYLQSPCFNFTGITDPVIEFKLWWISEPDFDGASLLYSIDDAVTWNPVGAYGDLNNWFNFDTIITLQNGFNYPAGWSFISNNWIKVKHLLPPVIANNPDVKFRFVFASNNLSVDEGFAFDDVAIYDNQPDIGVTALISPTSACSLSDTENITVNIRNYGGIIYNIGDTIKTGLIINGSQVATDIIVLTAPFYPNSTISHTFSTSLDLHLQGNFIIDTYTLLSGDLNSSNNSYSTTVTNYGYPLVTLLNLQSSYCNDAFDEILSGSPAGGIFSGSGVTDSIFSPSSLVPATYEIIYSYSDIYSCSGADTLSTIIYPVPIVNFTGLDTSYCAYSIDVTLTGSPSDGTFSGSGITGNIFSPNIANTGIHTITYAYTNINNCSNSISKNVQIFSIPTVNFIGLDTFYCTNVSDATLTGSPSGGTFTGQGIIGNIFSSLTAGSGNHIITYLYTDTNLCTNSSAKNVIVYDAPVVNFTGLDSTYCINATNTTLLGSPSGGTFSGLGINGNTFSASNAGIGIHIISYQFTDINSCSDIASKNVSVISLPIVSFSGLDTSYCINSSAATLTGSPSGGTFSGSGTSGNIFTPANANIGINTINYFFTDTNSCSNLATKNVSVFNLPIVNFSGLDISYCLNESGVTLTGTPSGGTFIGQGITGNSFSPSSAGVGAFTVLYTFTDNNYCSNSDSKNVTIFDFPIVNFSGLDSSYCINAIGVSLTGSPVGGTFIGQGITENTFIPNSAGTGSHVISYQFTDSNNCSVLSSQNVNIYTLPIINFSGLNLAYCIDSSGTTLTGSPSGGIFSGAGITGNIFNPADAGAGIQTISYQFTDNNSCSNSNSQNTTVYLHPLVSFSGLDTAYCENNNIVSLSGFPTNGTFSGQGITGNSFDPFTATPGYYQIVYTYISQSVCATSDTQFVSVHETPITSFNGLDTAYCRNDAAVFLTGLPTGGIFSGDGLNGNIFNPINTSSTNIIISYSYTNSYGCENHTLQNTTVYNLPLINFSGLNNSYCINSNTSTLIGNPPGGVFSGNAVTGIIYNPSLAPIGEDTVFYLYTNIHGCMSVDLQTAQINGLPAVSFTGLDSNYCLNNNPTVLLGNPSGGSFTGGSMSGNIFSPTIAGSGIQQILYSYTDFNGCTNKDTAVTTVYSLPIVSLVTPGTSFCQNSQAVTLTGTPAGGIFNGSGVIGNIFNPEFADTGNFYISYFVSDIYGCINGDSNEVAVFNPAHFAFSADTLKGNFPFLINPGNGFATYLWGTGSTQQMLTVNAPGWYFLTVTNTSGCYASDSVYIAKSIGIDEIDASTKISLYPNPTNSETTLTIESENPEIITIELMNSFGIIVFTKKFHPSVKISEKINLSGLAKGIYYLKIQKEEKYTVRKLVVDLF